MSITTLYAELVVVGTGTLLFIVLSFYAYWGDLSFVRTFAEKSPSSTLGATIVLIPILSVIYLLGIIVANVSHIIFEKLEKHLRLKKLAEIRKEVPPKKKYERLRTELYTSPNTQNFVHDFEFRRSKVRICRGWCLNCLLIIGALLACFENGRISVSTTVFWGLGLGFLAAGAFTSWYTATTTELDWMSSFAEQRSNPQTTKHSLPPSIDA
jgi:hypothetical protein